VGILTDGDFLRFDLANRSELPWFNPEGGRIAEVSEDGTLVLVNEGVFRWRLWEVEANKPLEEYFDLSGGSPSGFRYNLVLAPDNHTFVMTVITGNRLLLWHRGNPKPQQLLRPGHAQNRRGTHYPFLVFSADSSFLVGAQITLNGLVSVWDLPSGTVRWSLPQEDFVWALAIHPSGKILAVATDGGLARRVIRFLDATTGAELTRFNWNASRIRCLAFSPDGLTCAAGYSDRRLVVWDVDF
jgi:WD40 repeat protein